MSTEMTTYMKGLIQQVTKEGRVRQMTEVIIDLKMCQNQLSEEIISDYTFRQQLYNYMHLKLRQQAKLIYNEDDTLKQIIKELNE